MAQVVELSGRNVSEDELVQRACDLIPQLRASAAEAQKLQRLPDETIAALEERGLLRIMAPRARGGAQASLETFNAVLEALARGCGSTSWVAGIYNGSPYMLAAFSEKAQDEFYATPNARSIAAFTPSGQALPVDGGYRLTGVWRFGTGQHHAHWALLNSLIVREGQPPEVAQFLVPKQDCTVVDDWQVAGLAATGSNTITVTDAFVPAHRVLLVNQPAAQAPNNPYLAVPAISFFTAGSCGTPLGLASAALDLFHERIKKRGITYTQYERQNEAVVTHLQMDEATMKLDQARYHASRAIQGAMGVAKSPDDVLQRVRIRADAAWTLKLCRQVVEIVQLGSGASAIHLRDPLQLIVRDIQALSLHAFLVFPTNSELHGRVLCGVPPIVPWY